MDAPVILPENIFMNRDVWKSETKLSSTFGVLEACRLSFYSSTEIMLTSSKTDKTRHISSIFLAVKH